MRISDWSSDVCSSDLKNPAVRTVVNKVKSLNRIATQSSVLHFGGCLDFVLRSPTSRTNFGRSRWNCWLAKMIFMWSCGRAELGSGSISGMSIGTADFKANIIDLLSPSQLAQSYVRLAFVRFLSSFKMLTDRKSVV